jgi:drug/metabolite transporter (DMT)-like permease
VSPPSLRFARLQLLAAAILWSLGSFFIRLFQEPTLLAVQEPRLSAIQIAFYRALFAGLWLLPLLTWHDVRFRPRMLGMVLSFGIMNALYLSAIAMGSAANAILLQNTAPIWVYFLGVYGLGHLPHARNLHAILLGLVGALILLVGNWSGPVGETEQWLVLLMGLGSGITYAFVVLFLGSMNDESAAWLIVLNLLGTAAMVGSFVLWREGGSWFLAPTGRQLLVLAVFGGVQLAGPYVLFTRSLRTVSPAEASILTLIEPVLNPIWAYAIAPDRDTPTMWTVVGGSGLLAAMLWRYWPTNPAAPPVAD